MWGKQDQTNPQKDFRKRDKTGIDGGSFRLVKGIKRGRERTQKGSEVIFGPAIQV